MHRLNTSFVLGYHGCSSETAEELLSGHPFAPSENDYDWLGPGAYFWQSNPHRALQFAEEKRRRERARWPISIVGAVIDPGLCLDLSTAAGIDHVRAAHDQLMSTCKKGGITPPENSGGDDLYFRHLDCAVIRTLHKIREDENQEAIDTVLGIFIEGQRAYENAGFYQKTHIQICVCNSAMIHGVFRVPNADLT